MRAARSARSVRCMRSPDTIEPSHDAQSACGLKWPVSVCRRAMALGTIAGVLFAAACSTAVFAPAAALGEAHIAGHAARPASTLQLGSRGAAVRALQHRLVELTYLPVGATDGYFGIQTWHAVVAFQGWSGIERDGVVGARTTAALSRARRPVPWSTAEGMEVHISQQVLLLVRGGRVQRAVHVSTGRPGWPTPVGHFDVIERLTLSWSRPFETWMPLAQYFYPGFAIHEYPEVPDYPASHGCVRVPEAEAQTVWRFGRIGMRVWTGS